jgi:hypothetical protein
MQHAEHRRLTHTALATFTERDYHQNAIITRTPQPTRLVIKKADAAELRALDQAFGRGAAFYGPYLTERGAFGLRNTDAK